VSLPRWRVVKELVFEYCEVRCMRTRACGCICMLYVILVNTCRVDQLIFTVQCELSKLQINLVKIFHFFYKNSKNRFVSRLTGGFSPVFADISVQIQIDLNWSNRSVFTGLPLVNRYR
jgi:hypothetical protein